MSYGQGEVMTQVQTRVNALRTRVQQQTASLRAKIPSLGLARKGGTEVPWKLGPGLSGVLGGMETDSSFQNVPGGQVLSTVRGLVKRVLPGSGSQEFQGLPLVNSIRSKGLLGAGSGVGGFLGGREMLQTMLGAGYRAAPGVNVPPPQQPPTATAAGYRRFT